MLGVHLFFTKLLGCYAVEHGVPLPLNTFAAAIQAGQAHPYIYLVFAFESSNEGKNQIQVGDIQAVNVNGATVGAVWFYVVGTLGVEVAYSEHGRPEKPGKPVWHPCDDKTEIVLL